jgi:putative spermidine/putrescine transport system permease protein
MADAATRRRQLRRIALAPAMATIGLVLAAPMALMAFYSVMHYVPGRVTDYHVSLDSYARLFGSLFYLGVVLQTIKLSAIVTFASLALGYPVAFWLSRTRSRAKGLLTYLLFLPLMVGIVVRIYGWIVLLGNKGLVNFVLLELGAIHSPVRLLQTPSAVIFGLVETVLPFMIMPILSSLQSMDRRIEEAARATGATPWQAFLRVTLPMSLPGVVAGSLMAFSLSITAYALPALLGGSRVKMIAGLAYDAMLVGSNWPFGSAIGIFMTVVSSLIIYGYLRGVSRWA